MRVFVYGSLKKGFGNHACLAGAEYVGEAKTVRGYALYDMGAFPAMVHDAGQGQVTGEVYEVNPAGVERLDRLEGVPTFYQRVQVGLEGGEVVAAYTMMAERVREEGLPHIPSGVWTHPTRRSPKPFNAPDFGMLYGDRVVWGSASGRGGRWRR